MARIGTTSIVTNNCGQGCSKLFERNTGRNGWIGQKDKGKKGKKGQWDNKTMGQRDNGTKGQQDKGTKEQRDNGTKGH